MAQCNSGISRRCVGNVEHNHFGGACSNCADERDRAKKKKNDLTNEDWRESLKNIPQGFERSDYEDQTQE
jgi:hypothetical protein